MKKTLAMKPILMLLFFVSGFCSAYSQDTNSCKSLALFSPLAIHSIKNCEQKEFNKLEVKRKKGNEIVNEVHEGEYLMITYGYDGDFNKRPSITQIYRNYANAIVSGGGELLHISDYSVWGKLKKNNATYWIQVTSDGSGYYNLETVKEAPMRQDVVLTAKDIGNNLQHEGRAVLHGIYFDTDKAIVKPESAASMEAIATFLKANPTLKYAVVGHTDNTGLLEKNMTLSKERALAVANKLVTQYGVSKNQLTGYGVASLAPADTNVTDEGRAKNRRVEIVQQ
jgi:outer membrane protein OmpA-like peptidoglycan-associated protein